MFVNTEYIEIGSTPVEEDCKQVGRDSFEEIHEEATKFKELMETLTQSFIPEGAWFIVKSFQHDFGSYCEVCVKYFEDSEDAWDFAYFIEGNTPEKWDSETPESYKEKWENRTESNGILRSRIEKDPYHWTSFMDVFKTEGGGYEL